MKLDWKIYSLAGLLLAALASWGSRERTWTKTSESTTKTIEALTAEKQTAIDAKTALETQLKSDTDTTEEVVPIQMPNGQIAYITKKTSRTVQEAITRATSESKTRIAELERRLTEATSTSKTAEIETVKAAPRWYAGTDWQPLAAGAAAFTPQLGMNIGPLTIYAAHPLALELAPRIGAGLRF
jgi:hypothetical protein